MSNPFDFRQSEQPPSATASGFEWENSSSAPALTVAGPPRYLLFGAASTALFASLVALMFPGSMLAALIAWLLAGPVAVALLGLFTSRDIAARAAPVYVCPIWLPWAIRGAIVLIGVGVALSSWRFADWASR